MTYNEIDGWFDYQQFYNFVYNELPENAKIAEVGVWYGKSAAFMADKIKNGSKNVDFYAIDTWDQPITDRWQKAIENEEKSVYATFCKNMVACGVSNIVKHIQGVSYETADKFEDNSLDFVYIDADHSYDSVKKDLEAYFKKVKPGGIMGGHDYFSSMDGVHKAVDEFAIQNNLNIRYKDSWYIVKPK